MVDVIEKEIQNASTALESIKDSRERADLLNTILQLKISLNTESYKSEIYLDLKQFIKEYIKSLDHKKYYYDEFQIDKIFNYLKYLDIEQECSILQFLIRQLKSAGLDENLIDKCYTRIRKKEIRKAVKFFQISDSLRLIYLLTTFNAWTIIGSFILAYLVTLITLLPAPTWSHELFDVKYHNYHNNFVINHAINVLGAPFDISDNFQVIPISVAGFLVSLTGHLFFILVIFNILVKHFQDRIKN